MISLFDSLARYQVYVEGLKAGQALILAKTMRAIATDVRQRLNGLKYKQLNEMTKAEVMSFIVALKSAHLIIYNQYLEDLLQFLQDFTKQNHKMIAGILLFTKDKKADIPDEDNAWTAIKNTIIPASGLILTPFLQGFANKASADTANAVLKGYAARSSVSDTLATIVGSTNQKALLDAIFNGGKAVSNTAIQLVNAVATEQVAKSVYNTYQWVSIIDNKTSDICLGLEGQIFIVGEGPLPPMHINCRSHVYYITNDDDGNTDYHSFGQWLKDQDEAFINDVFGEAEGKNIISGVLKLNSVKLTPTPLNLDQFVGKQNFILGKENA